MATSESPNHDLPEEYLAGIDAELEASESTPITSVGELARQQEILASQMFGDTPPIFRTRLTLRFSGSGVQGHELPGAIGAEVVTRIINAVKAAGARVKNSKPDAMNLYWSPNVAPGSTILELFGEPRAIDAQMDLDPFLIPDSPVDLALGSLFDTFDLIDPSVPGEGPTIDGVVGKELFKLTRDLVDSDIDLDLNWEKPKGSTRTSILNRERATHLRNILDHETTKETKDSKIGELILIGTDGTLKVKPDKGSLLKLHADSDDLEALRALWAKRVRVTFNTITKSHPQRDAAKVRNQLTSIDLVTSDAKQRELSD
ncbi:MAG: hypothetical protein V9E85_12990 [Candidatus Nanopelagicales bacterium]